MPMPETAVHENRGFVFRQNDVRANVELLLLRVESSGGDFDADVKAKAVAHFVQH